MIQSEEISSAPDFFRPDFLPKQTVLTSVIKKTSVTQKFNVFHSQFGRLAGNELFSQLRSQLLEVDISEELLALGTEKTLEITLPVLGIVDLLNPNQTAPQPFASMVGINGFGAKSQREGDNHPQADYILITDIVGNQYEILIDQNNKIELPREGTGLFSIPSAMTFIFSEQQVKQGRGLRDLQAWGLEKNKLYLLPPVEMEEDFAITLCVSHLNLSGQRVVDTVRSIKVQFAPCFYHWHPSYLIHRHPDKGFFLELALRGHSPFKPFMTIVTVKGGELKSSGWRQDPLDATRYSKRFGLNKETLVPLLQQLYPLSSWMIHLLHGRSFLLTNRGYNQFMLWQESIEILYDLLIQDIINLRLTSQFLLNELVKSPLSEITIDHLPAKFHDSVVLEDLATTLQEGNLFSLLSFLAEGENIRVIKERLFIDTVEQALPWVAVDITFETDFSQALFTPSEPLQVSVTKSQSA